MLHKMNSQFINTEYVHEYMIRKKNDWLADLLDIPGPVWLEYKSCTDCVEKYRAWVLSRYGIKQPDTIQAVVYREYEIVDPAKYTLFLLKYSNEITNT